MDLHSLTKTVQKRKKRIGRGHGSGKVKTGGRGTKGQKARGRIRSIFEGGQLPLSKRLPFKRGKNRNKPLGEKPLVINIKDLSVFTKDAVVDQQSLLSKKLVDERVKERGVKILGDGNLSIALVVKVICSKPARDKIVKAGGKVEV
ncbi:50S ribosomal protein L15 [Candidatus Microgenomates bacterium]|nr:50S ribosomal protein L15 [Candidatus Microgenomates bacterium]